MYEVVSSVLSTFENAAARVKNDEEHITEQQARRTVSQDLRAKEQRGTASGTFGGGHNRLHIEQVEQMGAAELFDVAEELNKRWPTESAPSRHSRLAHLLSC
jgi:hypothetical protein